MKKYLFDGDKHYDIMDRVLHNEMRGLTLKEQLHYCDELLGTLNVRFTVAKMTKDKELMFDTLKFIYVTNERIDKIKSILDLIEPFGSELDKELERELRRVNIKRNFKK